MAAPMKAQKQDVSLHDPSRMRKIAEMAYHLWEKRGRPHGNDMRDPDLRLLIVDHGTGFEMNEQQVQIAVDAVAPLARKFRSSALAVSTDVHYGIARQFSSHFMRAGIVSGAFKDEVAAGVWLLGTGG